MRFLKTIFWTLIAVLAGFFSWNNWTEAKIALWDGNIWHTMLPVPLLFAFLLGLLPTLLLHHATRWSLRRKLETTKRALVEAQRPDPHAQTTIETAPAMQPVAAPIAVPPGVL